MIAALLLACLTLYVVLDATAQAGITLRNRQYVPPLEQHNINRDLHRLLPTCYLLACLCAAGGTYDWRWLVIGPLLRFALFDPVLNKAKGDPLFALGTSALTDRLLHKVGGTTASAVLRGLALVGVVALLLF